MREPDVGLLDLLPVVDLLAEDAVVVADAVADRADPQRRHRVHEARGEAAEASVAEPRILLDLEEAVEVAAERAHRLAGRLDDAEVAERVAQEPPREVLHREVVDALAARVPVALPRAVPAIGEARARRVGDGVEEIELAGRVLVAHPDVFEVVQDRLADRVGVHAERPVRDARVEDHAAQHSRHASVTQS